MLDLNDQDLLTTMIGYPEMWNIASKKKSVLSKLYNFLRGALNGAVTIGYPSIIVLLAYLPEEVRKRILGFVSRLTMMLGL